MSKYLQRNAEKCDIEGIAQLISESWKCNGPKSEMHVGDLYWACFHKRVSFQELNPSVWETPEGSIVAYSMVSKGGWCDLVVHPEMEAADFVHGAVAAAEDHVRRLGRDLKFGRRISNEGVESALHSLGFTRMETGYPTLQLTLEGPTEEPIRNDEISTRLAGELTPSQRADAWNEAFPHDSRTEADIFSLMEAPGYREDLDLTCSTNTGTVAAFCTVWLDELTRAGLFEPVGTRPGFQRRGLARLLVQRATNRLYSAGARNAYVRVHSENQTARAFYQAAGFQQVVSNFGFQKLRT